MGTLDKSRDDNIPAAYSVGVNPEKNTMVLISLNSRRGKKKKGEKIQKRVMR